MEQFLYAQLDEEGVCVAMSQLSGRVDQAYMVRLTEAEYSRNLLGWRYEGGAFKETAASEPYTPEAAVHAGEV